MMIEIDIFKELVYDQYGTPTKFEEENEELACDKYGFAVKQIYPLPNGGKAVINKDNKMLAYSKSGQKNIWDWIRKDFKKIT